MRASVREACRPAPQEAQPLCPENPLKGKSLTDVEFRASALTITVVDPASVSKSDFAFPWTASCLALAPEQLRVASRDRRWATTWVVATANDSLLGVVPLYQVRGTSSAIPFYDPAAVLPACTVPAGPRGWCHVGGIKDLTNGVTLRAGLDEDFRETLRRDLLSFAVRQARRLGAAPAALHVRDAELPAFQQAFGPDAQVVRVSVNSILEIPSMDPADFLAGVPKSKRYRIRTEWRALADHGIEAAVEPATALCDEASELIADNKRRHGTMDHRRMASFRLRQWLAGGADDYRALALRATDKSLTGVVFIARVGDRVEVNEIGLAMNVPERHLQFTELLIYGPARYAMRHGCRWVDLGLDAAEPKILRGARTMDVWALAAPTNDS